MRYTIQLSREAIRTLDRVDRVTEQRLRNRLHQLTDAPEEARVSKMLVGAHGLRSTRVGDWRILYLVDHARASVIVVAIRPRGSAYRGI